MTATSTRPTGYRATRLVLASTSRYRRALLERLGLTFTCLAPDCDESQYRHLAPLPQAETLALLKARSLPAAAVAFPGADRALVIGSDQVVDLDGEVLPKPGTEDVALAQLKALSGRTHRLITAVAVHEVDLRPSPGPGPAADADRTLCTPVAPVAVDIHQLTMRSLPESVLMRYIKDDRPLDCAGSYVLERRGLALFSRIVADPETADDTAIVGLPVSKLLRLLLALGLDVLDVTEENGLY